MSRRYEKIQTTVRFLQEKLPDLPEIALILGSGLGPLADRIEDPLSLDYQAIPGFAAATAPGHRGRLVYGRLGGKRVLVMQGRFHYYEGHDISACIFPVQVFAALGISRLLVSNAAGGINRRFHPGDLMLLSDIITLFCPSPLRGGNMPELGSRFFDMSFTFDKEWRELAHAVAREQDFALQEGVYVFTPGPHFETPAEILALRGMGADAVGMSTVPEVIAARHAGLKVLGISCITNMAAGMLNQPLSGDEVNQTAQLAEERFCNFVSRLMERL
ncbi:MAG: purine-nucleoside phosphorylase [Negativicutes bacterium]|nr:purine-nucleoside phosphorylase [Negativicutes bacterium]